MNGQGRNRLHRRFVTAESPIISIVLPTFNRAAWLPKTIQAVLDQTYPNWELLVIDDGSTDHTEKVVKGFTDFRIKYVYQENAERSAARNRGMALASGRWISFLDSDDRYDRVHLEQLKRSFLQAGDRIILTPARLEDEHGRALGTKALRQLRSDAETILFHTIGTSQISFPSSFRDRLRFDEALRINEDTDFLIRATRWLSVRLAPSPTVVYTVHPENSVSLGGRHNVYRDRFASLSALLHREECASLQTKQKIDLLSNCTFGMARHHAVNGEWNKVRQVMGWSLLRFPTHRTKEKLYAMLHPASMRPTPPLTS